MAKGYCLDSATVAPGGEIEVELTDDRRGYTVHGEIMLLVLVVMFVLSFVSLLLCFYLRRLRTVRQRDQEADNCISQATELGSKPRVASVMYSGCSGAN